MWHGSGECAWEHPAGAVLVVTATQDQGISDSKCQPSVGKWSYPCHRGYLSHQRHPKPPARRSGDCSCAASSHLGLCWASTVSVVWLEKRNHHSRTGWGKAPGDISFLTQEVQPQLAVGITRSWQHRAVAGDSPHALPDNQGWGTPLTGKTFPVINVDKKKMMRIDWLSDSN